jgi:phosphopantothenoylcysteine decarboxylase/phosphopantothenate--cysteine ligase
MLQNKKILLGITGCIAAYKACEIIRLLQKQGAEVKVMATQSALEFITPLTLQTLSQHPVYHAAFDAWMGGDIQHISLARWADMILIAPLTANTLAKLACGIADNLLTSVCLAARVKIALAPAMNCAMWENHNTQKNMEALISQGFHILPPISGRQACDEYGTGNMMLPTQIVKNIPCCLISSPLAGQRIIITAGATVEPLDPVRFLANRSSGKMGAAMAQAAVDLGLDVTLIAGRMSVSVPDGVKIVNVYTAQHMHEAVLSHIEQSDIFISVAAVADYRPVSVSTQKIKKHREIMQLALQRNPDILTSVSRLPKNRPFVIGFAAETENIEQYALEKLRTKNLDMVLANEVGDGKGFEQDYHALTVLTKDNCRYVLPKQSKLSLAYAVFSLLSDKLSALSVQPEYGKETSGTSAE